LKGQTSTSGKESLDSTNIRHKVKSKYENEESNRGSNETRSEENKSKSDATAEVFTPKALSEINKPGCILLTGNNRFERELDTRGKERSSFLRLEKDECLLTEGSEA
jgi:hypothetical protein